MNYIYFILGLVFNIICLLILAYRSRFIFKFFSENLKVVHALLINALVLFLNYLTPLKIGSVGYPIVAKKISGIKIVNSIKVAIFEPFFDLFWQFILLIILIFYLGSNALGLNNPYTWILFLILFIIILILIFYNFKRIFLIMIKIFPGWIKNRVKRLGVNKEIIMDIPFSLSFLIKDYKFIISYMGLTFLVIFFVPFGLYFSSLIFDYPFNFLSILMIYWASFIIGRLSGIPGGLGTRDIAMGFLLNRLGVPTLGIINIILFYRLINLIPSLIIGVYSFLHVGKKIINDRKGSQS